MHGHMNVKFVFVNLLYDNSLNKRTGRKFWNYVSQKERAQIIFISHQMTEFHEATRRCVWV